MEIDSTQKLIPVTSFDRYTDRCDLVGVKPNHFMKNRKIYPKKDENTEGLKIKVSG